MAAPPFFVEDWVLAGFCKIEGSGDEFIVIECCAKPYVADEGFDTEAVIIVFKGQLLVGNDIPVRIASLTFEGFKARFVIKFKPDIAKAIAQTHHQSAHAMVNGQFIHIGCKAIVVDPNELVDFLWIPIVVIVTNIHIQLCLKGDLKAQEK